MNKLPFLFFICLGYLPLHSQLSPCYDRTDLETVLEPDRAMLKNLILDYLVTEVNPNYDVTDPNPQNSYIEYKYTIVGEHTQFGNSQQTAINHSNEEFLSWHREYLSGLEDYLLNEGYSEFVPLPYWDPTVAMPTPFYNAMIQEYLDSSLNTPPIAPEFISDPAATWGSNILITDDLCSDFDSADDLGNFLLSQAMHSSVHYDVGGAMRSQAATSGAAIFWPLHANIDRFYQCYQVDCQCPQVVVSGSADNCDFCIDISNSTNSDNYIFTLIDAQGNPTPVNLNSNGCISYLDMVQGANYTLNVQAFNSEMTDNVDCPNDIVNYNFTAPYVAPTKFEPNPCIGVEMNPQFPTSTSISGFNDETVVITNTSGDGLIVDITNENMSSFASYTLSSNLYIASGSSVTVTIPSSALTSGSNYFGVSSNNDLTGFSFNVN